LVVAIGLNRANRAGLIRCNGSGQAEVKLRDRKLNFAEALERIGDELPLDRDMVQADALKRKVWIAEWHIPGCISELRAIVLTKRDAIDAAVDFTGADGDDEIEHKIRGIRTALKRTGSFQHHTEMYGNVVTTIERRTLGDLL
jgi:hypothetical protein